MATGAVFGVRGSDEEEHECLTPWRSTLNSPIGSPILAGVAENHVKQALITRFPELFTAEDNLDSGFTNFNLNLNPQPRRDTQDNSRGASGDNFSNVSTLLELSVPSSPRVFIGLERFGLLELSYDPNEPRESFIYRLSEEYWLQQAVAVPVPCSAESEAGTDATNVRPGPVAVGALGDPTDEGDLLNYAELGWTYSEVAKDEIHFTCDVGGLPAGVIRDYFLQHCGYLEDSRSAGDARIKRYRGALEAVEQCQNQEELAALCQKWGHADDVNRSPEDANHPAHEGLRDLLRDSLMLRLDNEIKRMHDSALAQRMHEEKLVVLAKRG